MRYKMKGYARLKNACKYADVSQTTMRNWFSNGLKFSKVKGILLIKLTDIDNYIAQYSKDSDRRASAIASEVLNDLQYAH